MATADLSGCVLVSGMPGAGKSTVSRLAGSLLPKAAQVKGDDVQMMIVSGAASYFAEPGAEALRQYDLTKRNMCALAANFADYGFSVFMDTVVQDRPMLDFMLALLAPRPVRLVVLSPGIEVCRQRNAMRPPIEQFAFARYDELEADMRRDLSDVAWWFDTSALTARETAQELVRDVVDRAPLLRGEWFAGLDHVV